MSTEIRSVRSIFLEAVENHAAAEWPAFLDSACGSDEALRGQVLRLLEAHAHANSFMALPAGGMDAGLVPPLGLTMSLPIGTKIGRYKLLEQIGEGGMGVVYVAEQAEPVRRKVALKIIKPGMDSREVISRFEIERQALAIMDHPNIARVLDAGTNDSGHPYFVMELVRGLPITEYCDKAKLTPRQRLELFVTVCQAVQHAHLKGIIHRDLKPSNVMITLHDGTPVVKVIDFGVAKAMNQQLSEHSVYTAFAQILGTPLYMSPEQAEMSGLDIDTRSDVYSLGVLLYELLTGLTPFDRETFHKMGLDEMRRMIREDEPARPSQRVNTLSAKALSTLSQQRGIDERRLSQSLRSELDWIVMKALEKDRTRRYESASAFGADVQRYLDDESVQACPPSVGYRFRKFARRNKASFTSAALVVAALLIGVVVSVWQAWEATNARIVADERLKHETAARSEAQIQQKRAGIFLDQALEAIDQMLIRVSDDKLLDVPQMDTVRRELLEDAVQLYRNLAKENRGNLKVELALGNALQSLAGMQNSADSLKSIRESLDLFQSLARRTPSQAQYMAEVADCYRFLGWSLLHLGRQDESEAACRESLRLGEQAYPHMPDAQGRIAQAKLIVAYVLNARKKYAEAEPILRDVLPIHEEDFAESPYHYWSLAVNLEQLGITAEGLGRDAEALAFHRSSKAVANKYLDFLSKDAHDFTRRPDKYDVSGDMHSKSHTQFFIVLACNELGVLQERLGSLEDAAKNYREAKQIVIELVANHPNVPMYADWLRITEERHASLHSRIFYKFYASGHVEEAAQIIDELPSRTAEDLLARARAYEIMGNLEKALADYNAAVELESGKSPQIAKTLNNLAWRLATSPELNLRDSTQAVQLSERAVKLDPNQGVFWNTLGVARYRAGDRKAAIAAFEKSMELRKGGDSFDWFFLAMSQWQLGEKELARKWYDQAVEWMDKNKPEDEELRRFQAEAESLLNAPSGDH